MAILNIERNFNKRLMSAMIYIKRQKNGINRQVDIEFIDEAYMPLLNNL